MDLIQKKEAILGKSRMAFVFIYKGSLYEKQVAEFSNNNRTENGRSKSTLEGQWNEG
jgi:hypothetical protein